MRESISLYLNDIGRVPLLHPDEEFRIARKIKNGRIAGALINLATEPDVSRIRDGAIEFLASLDQEDSTSDDAAPAELSHLKIPIGMVEIEQMMPELEAKVAAGIIARDKLIAANLRYVVSVAKTYPRSDHEQLNDYIQEGTTGLERAAGLFDCDKGAKFITYADPAIRHAIREARNSKSSLWKISRDDAIDLRNELILNGGDHTKLAPDTLATFHRTRILSLDSQGPSNEDAEGKVLSFENAIISEDMGPEELAIAHDTRQLRELLDKLDPESYRVVAAKWGLFGASRKTFPEIVSEQGITLAKAKRIHKRALVDLKKTADFYAMDIAS